MRLAGVVLAGGDSRRMGSPKALLDLGGKTFLSRIVELFAAHCEEIVVVTGVHDDAIRAAAPQGVRLVRNPLPERGQFSSLQCGLATLDPSADAALFTPVDIPAVRASTVAALVGAAGQAPIVVPRHNGRGGHPALLSAGIVPSLLALAPESRTDNALDSAGLKLYIDVDDPGIRRDADDPDAYHRLLKDLGR